MLPWDQRNLPRRYQLSHSFSCSRPHKFEQMGRPTGMRAFAILHFTYNGRLQLITAICDRRARHKHLQWRAFDKALPHAGNISTPVEPVLTVLIRFHCAMGSSHLLHQVAGCQRAHSQAHARISKAKMFQASSILLQSPSKLVKQTLLE